MRKSIKINYNNKCYQTFINENKLYFLRIETINGNEIYFNLSFNEYLNLNKKFNEIKPFLCVLDNSFLKIRLGLLGLIILPISLRLFELPNNFALEKNNIKTKIEFNNSDLVENNLSDDYKIQDNTVIIYNNDGLSHFLGYDNITFEELRKTLDENKNLNEIYRSFISSYIDELEIKMPNVNLSCFNENLKLLKITDISKEEMFKKTGNANYNGYFEPLNHDIFILNTLFEDQYCSVVTHELTHMLNNLIIEKNGQTLIKRPFSNNAGLYISEGFNEYINNYLFNYNSSYCSYRQQVDDVEIFIEMFGNGVIDDYLNGNLDCLKNRFEKIIGKEDTEDLFITMSSEVISLEDSTVVLDSSTIVNKYDLLMKCYGKTKNNKLNSSEIEIMKKLFADSSSIYEYETFNKDKFYGLNTEIKDIVLERIDTFLVNNNTNNLIDITLNNKSLGKYELSELYLLINQNNDFKIVSMESNENGVFVNDLITSIPVDDLNDSSFQKLDFIDTSELDSIDVNTLYENCSEYLSATKKR